MKVVLLGNAGAGKSTLARRLLEKEAAARLSLDELAFSEGARRRPLADSINDALHFIDANESWIIEGCYSDIVEPLLEHAETLIFLNPGVEACVRHCKARPWEPEKFESIEAQNANLTNLISWVKEYESRTDEYGLKRHRALFDGFAKNKVEYNSLPNIARYNKLHLNTAQTIKPTEEQQSNYESEQKTHRTQKYRQKNRQPVE